jgi:uncharacterized phage protein (TIGR01671 family)
MREIKFRGKDNITGEWVFGSFIPDALEGSNSDLISWGFIRRYNRGVGKMETIEVDRETVGQYTGLKDKNGTEIYEGDIVSPSNSWNPELKFVVTFGEGVFDSGYYSFTGFYLISDDGRQGEDQYELSKDSVYEIIGNIHDNPELLGGAG